MVAHSQGSVITVDLLRYLNSRGSALLSPQREIHLLTVGCPLRQLYAARFSALYGWAVNPQIEPTGLASWTNAYGSGDYVGRNLWDEDVRGGRWNPGRLAGATILRGTDCPYPLFRWQCAERAPPHWPA